MPKLNAAGATDVGRQREVNEDRFHVDAARGVFIVVDGVGGQAAGGKAADTAIATLRERLEQQNGLVTDRIREAITAANNEIHRQAALRPEWEGMACVLTVAVIEGDRAVIGHVGDTRLYTLRGPRIEKVTPDHSPVGEREDAKEISELEAMRHPRRNEVYRDVGSDAHEPGDADFISTTEIDVHADTALLICSDGLTDLVPSEAIRQTVAAHAGRPDDVVRALIDAANAAGGKDNVTVVYAEGSAFAKSIEGATRPARGGATQSFKAGFVRGMSMTLLAALVALAVWQLGWPDRGPLTRVLGSAPVSAIVVRASDSIMTAIARAPAGSTVVVEPGEYRERLVLKNDVRVISRVPRGATLRLPGSAAEGDPAVVATDITGAELVGFRIVGDAATPLGTGVITRNAGIRLLDMEISGAATAAVDLGPGDAAELVGSEIHGNGGAALIIRTGAGTRIAQNVFTRNGTSDRARGAFVVETAARPRWQSNVFQGVEPPVFVGWDDARRVLMAAGNWFVTSPNGPSAPSPTSQGRRGK